MLQQIEGEYSPEAMGVRKVYEAVKGTAPRGGVSVWDVVRALLVACAICVSLLPELPPASLQMKLTREAMSAETGHLFVGSIRTRLSPLFSLEPDASGSATASNLRLTENGVPLGPPHSPHDEIRALGEGRYSHWGDAVWFSTSDNSDPRTNGRAYAISAHPSLKPAVRIALAICGLGGLLLWRDRISSLVLTIYLRSAKVRRSPLFSIVLGLFATLAVGLALFNSSRDAEAMPQGFAWALAVHIGIGISAALAPFLIGAGLAKLYWRSTNSNLHSIVILSYPIGLCLLALAVFVKFMGGGWLAASVPVVAGLVSLFAVRLPWQECASFAKAVLGFAPFAALLAGWMGLNWHGPFGSAAGHASGDLQFYANSIWAIDAAGLPVVNFGSEGEYLGISNVLLPALGALFIDFPGFDPYLFILCGACSVFVMSTGIILLAITRDVARRRPNAATWAMLSLCVICAGRYPFWIAESPPVAHVAPLALSLTWLAFRSRTSANLAPFTLALALGGSAVSKVTAAAYLAPLSMSGVLTNLHKIPTRLKILLVGIALAGGVYVAFMLQTFLPAFLQMGQLGPESYYLWYKHKGAFETGWPLILRDAGATFLALIMVRYARLPFALSIMFAMALFLMYAHLLRINHVCAILSLGVYAVIAPDAFQKARGVIFCSLLMMLPAMMLADPLGLKSGFVWLVSMSGLMLIVIAFSDQTKTLSQNFPSITAAATALVIVVLAGASIEARRYAPKGSISIVESVPAEASDVWRAVRQLTDSDALVFTDQTGLDSTLLGGWNTLAFSGQRQVFVANWVQSIKLRTDEEARREKYEINEKVLSGTIAPNAAPVLGDYGQYAAVVHSSRVLAADWRQVYSNGDWTLYLWVGS